MRMNFLNIILKPLRVALHKTASLNNEKYYYQTIIQRLADFYIDFNNDVHEINDEIFGIIFSKDRAMQLQALLTSYFNYTKNYSPLSVIYAYSNEQHKQAYEILKKEFQSFPVSFIIENDFSFQLKEIVRKSGADRLFFMTDDAIFLDYFDLNNCLQFHPVKNIFSLRLGVDLDYCFAYSKDQALPNFATQNFNQTAFLIWKWKEMTESPDWSYPLSLDGTIFYRKEIEALLSHISFTSPNSLEAELQLYKDLFLGRNGICFSKVKYVNVPCNIVQKEFNNKFNDSHSIEQLVEYFLQGQRIDWRKMEGLKAPEAQKTIFTFTDSEEAIAPKKTKLTD